jgi:hypothetical protein
MSVRERPVANKILDAHQKTYSYEKHVHAVVSSRATIDTTQPATPRRLLLSAMANDRHRKKVLGTYAIQSDLVVGVMRPGSGPVAAPRIKAPRNKSKCERVCRTHRGVAEPEWLTPTKVTNPAFE